MAIASSTERGGRSPNIKIPRAMRWNSLTSRATSSAAAPYGSVPLPSSCSAASRWRARNASTLSTEISAVRGSYHDLDDSCVTQEYALTRDYVDNLCDIGFRCCADPQP